MKVYKFIVDVILNNKERTQCGIKVKAPQRSDAELKLEKELTSIYSNLHSYQITDFRVCI